MFAFWKEDTIIAMTFSKWLDFLIGIYFCNHYNCY